MPPETDWLHYFLELSYFVFGGVVLAVIGCFGLYQLVNARKQLELANKQLEFAKQSLKINSKRDAYSLTAECCDHYLTVIIPLLDKFDRKIESKGITFFEDAIVKVTADGITVENAYPKKDIDARIEIANHSLAALNALEGFSVYFTSGVAEETIAFETVGRTFLTAAGKLAPDFLLYASDGYFQNLSTLFMRWSQRQEKQRLETEKLKLENESSKFSISKTNAIGTE